MNIFPYLRLAAEIEVRQRCALRQHSCKKDSLLRLIRSRCSSDRGEPVLGSVPALLQKSLSPHALSDSGELTRSSRTSLFSRPQTHTDLYLVSCLKGLICLLQAILGGCVRSCSTRHIACTRFFCGCARICSPRCIVHYLQSLIS